MPVISIVFVVIIDGLAIYGSSLLALWAGGVFSRTRSIHRHAFEPAMDRAHAWYAVAGIGVLVLLASAITGWVFSAGQLALWPFLGGMILITIGTTAGQGAEKVAYRLE